MFGRSVCHDFPDRLIRQPRGCAHLAAFLAIVSLLGLPDSLCAQQHPDSIAVVLGAEFKNEWPYGMLFGDHHQSLWTTPVTIELLRLSSDSGALKPCREIVTPDNRLLLLATPSGDTVVFTPLRERFSEDDVDPRDRRLIPTHPSSALVADELSRAAGLMTSQPRMVWLPDDPLLGRFRDTYGGSAGFLASTGPGGMSASVPFLDSRELFRTLDADSRNGVDTRAFILSRFIDLLTGDWQRSIWKWWWFAAPENGRIFFSPMPAMRRQSLLMLSSFPATIHGALTPGFLNFTGDLSDVSRAVATGAALDVRVLSGMDRSTWEGLAREFTASMSDSAIDAAVLKFPPPHRQVEGDTIARLLKVRRDSLASVSARYYLTIAEYAEVRLSHAAENVTVERLEDGRVNVTAWQSAHASTPVYSRVFFPDETKEIRLHCLGGNDSVIVRGSAGRSIVVRVDGGAGDDVLKDESRVQDAETGFLTWFSGSTAMTFLYDCEGTNDLAGGEGTIIDTSPESEFVPPGRFF